MTRADLEAAGRLIGEETGTLSLDKDAGGHGSYPRGKGMRSSAGEYEGAKWEGEQIAAQPRPFKAGVVATRASQDVPPAAFFIEMGVSQAGALAAQEACKELREVSFALSAGQASDVVSDMLDKESMVFLDGTTGALVSKVLTGSLRGIQIRFDELARLTALGHSQPLLSVHTHPSSLPFSSTDIESVTATTGAMVAAGKDGSVYAMHMPSLTASQSLDLQARFQSATAQADVVARHQAGTYFRRTLNIPADDPLSDQGLGERAMARGLNPDRIFHKFLAAANAVALDDMFKGLAIPGMTFSYWFPKEKMAWLEQETR